jgi:hypothetical protein
MRGDILRGDIYGDLGERSLSFAVSDFWFGIIADVNVLMLSFNSCCRVACNWSTANHPASALVYPPIHPESDLLIAGEEYQAVRAPVTT